jgi:calcineurin-like phosphoesterase family protein
MGFGRETALAVREATPFTILNRPRGTLKAGNFLGGRRDAIVYAHVHAAATYVLCRHGRICRGVGIEWRGHRPRSTER